MSTTDLNYFQYIVPCGLTKPVTSMRGLGCTASRERCDGTRWSEAVRPAMFETQVGLEPALQMEKNL